ncbi:Hypothetical predicted protein [Podarcis lilfordi]|uniref:Uncharacterized protein n=1 Tax=Podarcis lilfordi TaxID=74358 RepID=A0AA35KEP3_9SAUR|nr:Hypothetical predicted protein [Podarcis lilfordi]
MSILTTGILPSPSQHGVKDLESDLSHKMALVWLMPISVRNNIISPVQDIGSATIELFSKEKEQHNASVFKERGASFATPESQVILMKIGFLRHPL